MPEPEPGVDWTPEPTAEVAPEPVVETAPEPELTVVPEPAPLLHAVPDVEPEPSNTSSTGSAGEHLEQRLRRSAPPAIPPLTTWPAR